MRIGIIGCGNIGSALSRHWVKAGHEVILSAKHEENAKRLARELGDQARAASPAEAARQGEVILLTIPLGEVPKLGDEVRNAFKSKIVMDTCNPYPERDGTVAKDIIDSGVGMGIWSTNQFPHAKIVRVFNAVQAPVLANQAHRKDERIGVPLAADDQKAIKVASKLVVDAGFAPVVVGGLDQAIQFDVGTPSYGSNLPESKLRKRLSQSVRKAA